MQHQQKPSERLPLDKEHYLSTLFSGKLLLRKEILLPERLFQHLIRLEYFDSILSIKRKKFTNECQRCGNQKRSLFATIPCLSCGTDHIYCRKCIAMGRVIECEPLYYWSRIKPRWPLLDHPCTWKGKLTKDQMHAADRITAAVRNQEKELLIWGVCGSGKTEMLFPGITEALALGKRICIATPRTDVVRELLPRFQTSFPAIHIQGLYSGSNDKGGTAQLIIATTHQLFRYKEAFDVLIIDEIDAFPYHKDPSLPFATNRALKQGNTMIYLTATPRRKQRIQVARKKLPHIFVPTRFHGHPLPVPAFKMCFSLQKDLTRNTVPYSFLNWLKHRKHVDRQLLIFVPTIKLAESLKQPLATILLKEKMIKDERALMSVHAEDEKREEKIAQFRKKRATILLTTTILERGVTFPSLDVVVMDTGNNIFDEAALVQIAGRAGRSSSDPTGEVIFFHDGKTDAMEQAVHSIISMNKRGGFR